jgi:hypothetical protein
MATINITVTDLTFPEELEDKFCKFRPLISVKYKNTQGKSIFAREALPGLGPRDYWECEKDNKKKPNYVRHATLPKVDMDRVPDTQKEIVFDDLDLKSLERVEVELFDIDIKTALEKLGQKALKKLLDPKVMALINPTLPVTLTLVKKAVEEGTGKTVVDLEKGIITKLIGKDDGAARTIWTRSQKLTEPPTEPLTLTGPGTEGDFSITLEMEVS